LAQKQHTLGLKVLKMEIHKKCNCFLKNQFKIKKKKKSKYSGNTINSVSENKEDIILAIKSLLQHKL